MASTKLALLGATGPTGLQVLEQALQRGHKVKALVRNPNKINMSHANLEVEGVDIFSKDSLSSAFKDCSAVVSCLGQKNRKSEEDFYTNSMKAIAEAMRENNITRLVAMTSWGTYRDSRSPYFIEYFFRFIIAKVLESMRNMEVFLAEQCQDLDFTVVRPPGLSLKPVTDKKIQIAEECPCVPQGWGATVMMPRADVARCMLDLVEQNNYTKKAIAILTK